MTLTEYLRQNDIQQKDFAVRVQTTAPTINRICKQLVTPRRELLERIIKATDGEVTLNDLVQIRLED